MANITLFSQIIVKLDRSKFKKIVKEKQTFAQRECDSC